MDGKDKTSASTTPAPAPAPEAKRARLPLGMTIEAVDLHEIRVVHRSAGGIGFPMCDTSDAIVVRVDPLPKYLEVDPECAGLYVVCMDEKWHLYTAKIDHCPDEDLLDWVPCCRADGIRMADVHSFQGDDDWEIGSTVVDLHRGLDFLCHALGFLKVENKLDYHSPNRENLVLLCALSHHPSFIDSFFECPDIPWLMVESKEARRNVGFILSRLSSVGRHGKPCAFMNELAGEVADMYLIGNAR